MARLYHVLLYDENNANPVTALPNATRVRFTREIRGSGEVRFELPRDDERLSELRFGRFVRVRDARSGVDLTAGFLRGGVDIGVGKPFARVRAEGVLARLAFLRYPPDYRLRGTLAENVARLVQRFDVRRITAASTTASGLLGDEILSFDGSGSGNQLGAYTNTESVDLSPSSDPSDDGGAVVLTESGGVYAASGTYVTPLMDFKTAPTAFDRLRYGYDPSLGSVRYRVGSYANLTDARTFAGSPVEDAQPRGVGVDLSGLTARRYAAVEFTLSTSDTSVTPALEFVEVTARRAVSGIVAPTSVPSVAMGLLEVGGMSLYVALERICDRFGLEYRLAAEGTLAFQLEPAPGSLGDEWGEDRRNTATFVEGTHVNVLRYVRDDSALANAVVALGLGEGGNRLVCSVEDGTSQAAYGFRQTVWDGSEMTLDDLKARADAVLARRKEPVTRLELEVLATPDGRSEFAPGDLVRIVSRSRRDADGNALDVSLRVLRETREETPSGERIRLECGEKARTLTEGIVRRGFR
jgi:hypothetical protein